MMFLCSCNASKVANLDPFYQNKGGWDDVRIPLLKPYYVTQINGDGDWQIPLPADITTKDIYYYITLHAVEKIAVENNAIMVYTPYIEDVDRSIGQKVLHWFVFVPTQKIGVGFDDEANFLDYIHKYGIKQPLWVSPDIAYTQLDRSGCLDWIPECK